MDFKQQNQTHILLIDRQSNQSDWLSTLFTLWAHILDKNLWTSLILPKCNKINIVNTVKTPISNHPEYEDLEVALYENWQNRGPLPRIGPDTSTTVK